MRSVCWRCWRRCAVYHSGVVEGVGGVGAAGGDALCAALFAGAAGGDALCAALFAGVAGGDALCTTPFAGVSEVLEVPGVDALYATLLAVRCWRCRR